MIVVIFRSWLRPEAEAAYAEFAPKIEALARVQPGILYFKSFTASDGERVTIAHFESDEAVVAWRNHPEHREAQKRGSEEFYDSFSLDVAEVLHLSAT